jgi:hypothetical protein
VGLTKQRVEILARTLDSLSRVNPSGCTSLKHHEMLNKSALAMHLEYMRLYAFHSCCNFTRMFVSMLALRDTKSLRHRW